MTIRFVAGLATVAMILGGGACSIASGGRGQAFPSEVQIAAAETAPTATPAETTATPMTAPPPISSEEAFNAECSACHMAYPALFLPARSWQAITTDLTNHFGQDASLDPETTRKITNYLVANAADSPSGDPRILRGLAASEIPLRITETQWWVRRHREVPTRVFDQPDIKSKANCLACHGGGAYRDD